MTDRSSNHTRDACKFHQLVEEKLTNSQIKKNPEKEWGWERWCNANSDTPFGGNARIHWRSIQQTVTQSQTNKELSNLKEKKKKGTILKIVVWRNQSNHILIAQKKISPS